MYEAFRKLRPGVPVRALHGSMKQMKRMKVYYEFCEAKAMVREGWRRGPLGSRTGKDGAPAVENGMQRVSCWCANGRHV